MQRRCTWLLGLCLSATVALTPAAAAELDKFLPEDTEAVLTVNIRQVLESGVVKKYFLVEVEKGLKKDKQFQQLMTLLGLDPLKDVVSVTVASPGGTDQKKVLGIVHGSFDLTKIHAVADKVAQAEKDKLKIHEQDKVRIYEGKVEDQPVFAAFLNKEVVVISPHRTYVSDAVAKSTGKKEVKIGKNIQALVGQQDGKQSLWLAALASKELKDQLSALNPKAKELAGKLQSVSGGFTLSDDVKIGLKIQTSDPKASKEIRQQLEGLKALGTFAVTSAEQLKEVAPLLLDVLNSFKFSENQGAVGIELTISSSLIDKGVKKVKP